MAILLSRTHARAPLEGIHLRFEGGFSFIQPTEAHAGVHDVVKRAEGQHGSADEPPKVPEPPRGCCAEYMQHQAHNADLARGCQLHDDRVAGLEFDLLVFRRWRVTNSKGIDMKKLLSIAFVLLGTLLASGCASMADATAARGTGTTRTYNQPYNTVWDALLTSIKETDLEIVSQNKDTGTLLAKRSMTAFSYGENVAIFVDRVTGAVSTRVEIVNKRVLATNITAPDWDTRLFNALDGRLKTN